MLQLSAYIPNLRPQPKSSLINRLINDNLLDASFRCRLNSSISHIEF